MADELLSGSSRAIAVHGAEVPRVDPDLVPPPEVTGVPEGGEAGTTGSMARLIGRVFIENKMAVVGVAILVLMALFCFVGPLIYKTNQLTPNLLLLNNAPSAQHVFGTDTNGFDLLGR